MVCLDEDGAVVRPALLWNDTRSAQAARDLVDELGGAEAGGAAWAEAVGVVPVASFTVTKLRWLAEHEPEHARAHCRGVPAPRLAHLAASAAQPTWRTLTTDRSDASGTGYWSADDRRLPHRPAGARLRRTCRCCRGSLGARTRRRARWRTAPGSAPAPATTRPPRSASAPARATSSSRSAPPASSPPSPSERAATPPAPSPGSPTPPAGSCPLVATLNAARVLDATARLLGVDHDRCPTWRSRRSPPAPAGWCWCPTSRASGRPTCPDATGSLDGLTLATTTPAHLARAAVEGLLCGLADGLDALVAHGCRAAPRVLLVGGGAGREAVRADRADGPRPARSRSPSRGSTSPTAPPPGGLGTAGEAAAARRGHHGQPDATTPDPGPSVRERYAEATPGHARADLLERTVRRDS